MFGDFRSFWFDPENSDRVIIAGDGGIAISYDGGRTGDAYNNLPLGSIYASASTTRSLQHLRGLTGSRKLEGALERSSRPRRRSGLAVGDGDGMFTLPDPTDSRWLQYHAPLRRAAAPRPEARLSQEHHAAAAAGQGAVSLAVVHPHPHLPTTARCCTRAASICFDQPIAGITGSRSAPTSARIRGQDPPGVRRQRPRRHPWFTISSISESPVTAGVIWGHQ